MENTPFSWARFQVPPPDAPPTYLLTLQYWEDNLARAGLLSLTVPRDIGP